MPAKEPLLRNRLLEWLLIPLFVLLTADGIVSYGIALSFSERAYDKALVNIAHDIATHLSMSGSRVMLDLPQDALRMLLSDPEDELYFGVTRADGHLIAGQVFPLAAVGAAKGGGALRLYDARIEDARVRAVRFAVTPEMIPSAPRAVIHVAETLHKRDLLAREILLTMLAPQLILVLVSGLVVHLGIRHGLAPLNRLKEAVASRSHVDFSPIAISPIPGELSPLLRAINDLLGRLELASTAQRRFIDDAAHRLKTPVAVLQVQIELALRAGDAVRMRESVSRARSALERVTRTVSQLLSLARNESYAAPSIPLKPVDLSAVAFEAAASWVPEALKRDIDLGFDGVQSPLLVLGEPGRLRELLDNLLDNALRYSRDGGRVTLRVSSAPAPSVTVTDSAPRIPDDEKERIFGRFYRRLGNTRDGSGLGLAIVRNIAQLHGAQVSVRHGRGGGNIFEVTFPLFYQAD